MHNVEQADGTEAEGQAEAIAVSSGGAGLLGVLGSWGQANAKGIVGTTVESALITANTGNVVIQSKSRNDGRAEGLEVLA